MRKKWLQIDVKRKLNDIALMECELYYNGSSHTVFIPTQSYESLISEGFFVRDGKEQDGAGMINTTNTFLEKI